MSARFSSVFKGKRVNLEKNLHPFSINYFPFLPLTGDGTNNVLTFMSRTGCVSPLACVAFGFKVDEDDRSRYELIFREPITDEGVDHDLRFETTNGEPDIVILVVVNAHPYQDHPFNFFLKGKAFSAPVTFSFEKEWDEIGEDGDVDMSYVRLEGSWDDPQNVMSLLRRDEQPQPFWVRFATMGWDLGTDMAQANRRARRFLGEVPFAGGSLTARVLTGSGTVVTGEIRFPEPIEWPRWSKLNREGYGYGGLYGLTAEPRGQLVPPLLDFISLPEETTRELE